MRYTKKIVWLTVALAAILCTTCGPNDAEGVSYDTSVVRSVTLSESAKGLLVGNDFYLMAIVTPSSAVNQTITWASSNPAIATVNGSGNTVSIKGVGNGTATITATSVNKRSGKCEVNVSDIPVETTGIVVYFADLLLVVSENPTTLRARPEPWNANIGSDLTWTVSPPDIVELKPAEGVAEGLEYTIKALKSGDGTLKIRTGNGIEKNIPVSVKAQYANVDFENFTIRVGGNPIAIYTVLRPSTISASSVTWESENTSIATVTPRGSGASSYWALVTGVAAGKTRIKFTASIATGGQLVNYADVTVLPAWNLSGEKWFYEDFERYYLNTPTPVAPNNYWSWTNFAQGEFYVAREDDKPGGDVLGGLNRVGYFYPYGTGDRIGYFTFTGSNLINGNDIYAEFDLYPGLPAINWGMLALMDRAGSNINNKIFSLSVNSGGQMMYHLGNVSEQTVQGNSTGPELFEEIESMKQWFHVKIHINFAAGENGTVDFEITDLENKTSEARTGLALPTGINYNKQVAAIRLFAGRNDAPGWPFCLDNVYFGTVPKPED